MSRRRETKWRVRQVERIVGPGRIPPEHIEGAVRYVEKARPDNALQELPRQVRVAVRPLLRSLMAKELTAKDTAAARCLAKAIDRLEAVLDRSDIQALTFRFADGDEALREQLRDMRALALGVRAETKPTDHGEAEYKHRAAAAAARLLKAHGFPVTVTPPKSDRPGSVFVRVSAAIYGSEVVDMTYYCRTHQHGGPKQALNFGGK